MMEVQNGNFERIHSGENTDNGGNVPSAANRTVVRLSIVALFLTGFRRDPYPWIKYNDYSETTYGEIVIDFHPDLYLAQMLGPVLISLLVSCNVRVSYVREVFSIIHPPVCLWYVLGCVMGYVQEALPVCSFMLEMLHDSKVALYYYQIIIYSSGDTRSTCLILGTMAQCLGNIQLQWIFYGLGLVWHNSRYFMDLFIAMVHYFMFCPRQSWNTTLEDLFEENNQYAFREFIGGAVFGAMMLSSVNSVFLQWYLSDNDKPLKPFLPLFTAFDSSEYAWFSLITLLIPVVLEIVVCLFSPGKQWIVTFTVSFITLCVCLTHAHIQYIFYLLLVTMAMTSFAFGKALAHLVEVCPKDKIFLLPAAVQMGAHMAMYGFGGLLKMLPSSWRTDKIVLILCVVNGIYAVGLVVANELLVTDSSRIGRRRVRRIVRTIDL